jgi:hypothetical protein
LYIGYIKMQTQVEHCGASRGAAMPDIVLNIAEVDERIAAVRENLRQLVEQAAAYSGAPDEDLMSRRIAEQEAHPELLTEQRNERLGDDRRDSGHESHRLAQRETK